MPLNSAIYDADTVTPRPMRWGWWHLEVMTDIARKEGGFPDNTPMLEVWSLNGGKHEVQAAIGYRDPSDGEVLILHPGDQLEVWRD